MSDESTLSQVFLVRRRADHTSMPWKNGQGTTHEVAKYPQVGDEFGWRISFAEVTQPGAFSALPGIDRVITLVEGTNIALTIQQGPGAAAIEHVLLPGEPFAFPGEADVHAVPEGATVDLNVMTARAAFSASVDVMDGDWQVEPPHLGEEVLLSALGEVGVAVNGQRISLESRDVLFTMLGTRVLGAGPVAHIRIRPWAHSPRQN